MQQSTKSAYHEHAVLHNLVTLQKKSEETKPFSNPWKKIALYSHKLQFPDLDLRVGEENE